VVKSIFFNTYNLRLTRNASTLLHDFMKGESKLIKHRRYRWTGFLFATFYLQGDK